MAFQKTKFRKLKCQKIVIISKYKETVKKKVYDSHLQDFFTCSKWQPTHSLCCQYTKECHNTTPYITIMPSKPTFHASLKQTHHALPESTTNLFFFMNKTNSTPQHSHLFTYPPFSHGTMRMEFPLVEWVNGY